MECYAVYMRDTFKPAGTIATRQRAQREFIEEHYGPISQMTDSRLLYVVQLYPMYEWLRAIAKHRGVL